VAKVVVGVTGGIAAYKSAPLIRLFAEAGHSVQVVATSNALRFIGKTTLEALSKNPVEVVDPDLYTDVDQVKHVSIAQSADLIVVAPATASFIAKIAAGIADDLLTTTVLASKAPIVLAPAMHTEMWENAATTDNISRLESRGIHIVNPGVGRLTGDDSGAGRLAEPIDIFESATALLEPQVLEGIRVLVTAGGTREPIDAARFISNFSSGKQGVAFARAAKHMGAKVTVLAANIEDSLLTGIETIAVSSTAEMQNALAKQAGRFDLLVMAAAIADYRPATESADKIKSQEQGDSWELSLIKNPDLLFETMLSLRAAGSNVMAVGFAAETALGGNLSQLARKKLADKGCHYIVANDISKGEVFGSDQNSVLLTSADSEIAISGSKYGVAKQVLQVVVTKMREL
jgi:phosphopantothenoylcysteine decarboxylase/phosphopantothenate--cysteine ligase